MRYLTFFRQTKSFFFEEYDSLLKNTTNTDRLQKQLTLPENKAFSNLFEFQS